MTGGRRLAEVCGVAWLCLLAFLLLSPALKDGPGFGPADLGRELSLLTAPGGWSATVVHNNQNADVITQSDPWETLDWRLVHAGELPLWNDLSGNGLPQLLNFEASPLAPQRLVSYLAPLSWAELVDVAASLLIAGTGAYVLARLLGCRPLTAAFAGSTFMLSGSFVGWLGWRVSATVAFTGWVLAGLVLAYEGRRPRLLLPVAVAAAVYGGFPEAYVLQAGAVCVALGAGALARVARRQPLSARGAARMAVGAGAGLALSSPLWLPGIGVIRDSIQAALPRAPAVSSALPLRMAALIVAQGYDGLPLASASAPRGTWFGAANYPETAAYVGTLAVTLAIVALVMAWRRPAVAGLAAMAAACMLASYEIPLEPVQRLLGWAGFDGQPLDRALPLMSFALAMLAALGLEQVLARWSERPARFALAAALLAVAGLVALLWVGVLGAPDIPAATPRHPSAELSGELVRARSLLWPTAGVLLAAGATATVVLATRRGALGRRAAAAASVVLVAQSASLLFAGVGLNSFARSLYPLTPALSELRQLAGTSLVGLDGPVDPCAAPGAGAACGLRTWSGIGLYPATNLAYGIDELAVHDPITPLGYVRSFPLGAAAASTHGQNTYVPVVDSVALARRYGVGVVIVAAGTPVPAGMRAVATLRTPSGSPLTVARVPDAPRFSLSGASSRVLAARHPGDASYVLEVAIPGRAAQRLTARITDSTGWHAYGDDGAALPLRRAPGDLLSVEVPAGTRQVTLVYRPALLGVGLDLAGATLAILLGAEAAGYHPALLRRRAPPPGGTAVGRRRRGPRNRPRDRSGAA